MNWPPTESDSNPAAEAYTGPTDFQSLSAFAAGESQPLPTSPTERRPVGPNLQKTDFLSLKAELTAPREPLEHRGLPDYLLDVLTPTMIVVMLGSAVAFLLDVRYMFDERNDWSWRVAGLAFVLGAVALNRLIARDGREESILYTVGLGGVAFLFTAAMTGPFTDDAGSLARSFMNKPWLAISFNMTVVMFLWWLTNRLTHECCVDTDPSAGDIGILRGTIRRFQEAVKAPPPKSPETTLDAVDPSQWKPPKKQAPRPPAEATERLRRRHAGISIFYVSIPVMFAFVLGQRVLLVGGDYMNRVGWFYLACYTTAGLSLLMLTSLRGLREYFRERRTSIPAGLAPFWIGLGVVMLVIVLFGAAALPRPATPPPAEIGTHVYDPYARSSRFRDYSPAAPALKAIEDARFMEGVGQVVLVGLGLFLTFAALKALGAAAAHLGKQRHLLPQFLVRFFNGLDRLLERLTSLPSFARPQRMPRLSRDVALCAKYRNPLGDLLRSQQMTTGQMIEYSYEALCALAQDLGVPRQQGQTPYEFLQSFPEVLKTLHNEAAELTHYYVTSAYSTKSYDERLHDRLRKFWHTYEKVRRHVVR